MTFAHDTQSALNSTAALICTAETPDTLTTLTDLEAFIAHWQYTGSRTHDHQELHDVQQLRYTLRKFWHATTDEAAHLVNNILTTGNAQPRLVNHDNWGWHLHATTDDQPLAERMAVEAAMAMAAVIRENEMGRLKQCAAEHCTGVLVDLSRNRSRQYCGRGCGNRMHVAAYRARKAAKDD